MKKLLERYRKLNVQAKVSLWHTVTSIFQKGIGFFIVPLYTRLLSAEDYGRYILFSSWYEVMLIFGTLGVSGNSYNVGLTKFDWDRDRYTSSMMGFGAVCTIAFFLIVCVFHGTFEDWLGMTFPFICLLFTEIFWDPPLSLWSQRQRYNFKYRALNILTAVSTVMTPVIGATLIFLLPDRALGAILGKTLPKILAGMLCAFWILRKNRTLFHRVYWKYVLQFNVPLIAYYLAAVMLHQMDRIMIQKMGTTSQAGIYGVANTIAQALNIISGAINVSFTPYMFHKVKTPGEYKIGKTADFLIATVALCNLCPIILAPEAMKLLAPEEYWEGVWLVAPLAGSIFLSFVYQMYCNVEFYYERKYMLMWASCGVCVCNLILNYIFIGLFGYIAAGYTTLASNAFCLCAHMLCVRLILKKEKRPPILHNRFALGVCLLFCLCSAVMMLLYGNIPLRFGLLILTALFVFRKRRPLLEHFREISRKT